MLALPGVSTETSTRLGVLVEVAEPRIMVGEKVTFTNMVAPLLPVEYQLGAAAAYIPVDGLSIAGLLVSVSFPVPSNGL